MTKIAILGIDIVGLCIALSLKNNHRSEFQITAAGAEPENLDRAKGLFRWSILYMFGICLLLVMSRFPLAVQFDAQGLALLTQAMTTRTFL